MPLVAWSPGAQASRALRLERRLAQGRDPTPSESRTPIDLAVRCSSLPFVFGCQSSVPAVPPAAPGPEVLTSSGGADRGRTDDIQLAKLALYQLSYSPIKRHRRMVGLGGFEPPTSRLSGVRSKPAEL